jgi:hypothetical protein
LRQCFLVPSAAIPGRDELHPNCGNCFALCCTAFGFSRSADFPLDKPDSRSAMFAVFKIMRQLHEMLWYLAEAQERAFDPETGTAVQELRLAIRKVTEGPVPGLLALDVSRLEDADLSRALYLTQPQFNSARAASAPGCRAALTSLGTGTVTGTPGSRNSRPA